jgi:DNA-binding CsgD family transcriptional regulator
MTTPQTQETQPPEAREWLDKHEAAKRLDLNWRTVLAMAKAGKIRSEKVRDPETRQRVVKLHAGDIQRLCYDRDHPEPTTPLTRREKTVAEAVNNLESNRQIAARLNLGTETLDELLERIYQKMGVAGRLATPKPWLTLEEAAEYSGLPLRWLRTKAAEGSIHAIDVGSGQRHIWRFNRDGLAEIGR